MKMTTKLITTIGALMLVAVVSASAQGRIATVDLSRLFDDYWKTKQAKAALNDRGSELDKEHKGMLEQFNKAKDEYKTLLSAASDSAVSDTEREKKKKEAEEKLKGLRDQEETLVKFQNQARTTLDEQRRRMRDNILTEVRKAVDAKSKSAGYSLVIDTAAETVNNTPVVLYSNRENDITESVLAQLNSSAPPEVLKDEKPAPKK